MAKITRSGNSSLRFLEIYRSLSFRLIFSVGAILFVCISAWVYYNIEPFFTTKRVGMGTGLGLSISYGIIQAYHGIIRVETKEKEGARFVIQFPVPNNG